MMMNMSTDCLLVKVFSRAESTQNCLCKFIKTFGVWKKVTYISNRKHVGIFTLFPFSFRMFPRGINDLFRKSTLSGSLAAHDTSSSQKITHTAWTLIQCKSFTALKRFFMCGREREREREGRYGTCHLPSWRNSLNASYVTLDQPIAYLLGRRYGNQTRRRRKRHVVIFSTQSDYQTIYGPSGHLKNIATLLTE